MKEQREEKMRTEERKNDRRGEEEKKTNAGRRGENKIG